MKRRRDNQPIQKKPDVSASTDLRSKIGAKLQTLLLANRVEALKRRQAFLLGDTEQHSEIIIDPTIVIKTEAPETEEYNESTTDINPPNFLSSAKSRITELLNKQQGGTNKYKNSEKENSNSIIECNPISSVNTATTSLDCLQTQTSCNFQSFSCNSLNKRIKVTSNKNCLDTSDVSKNQVHLQSVVVLEDIMKSISKHNHLLSRKSPGETCSESSESCSKKTKIPVSKQRKNKAAKDHIVTEVTNSSASCDINVTNDDDSTNLSQSCRNSNSSDNISHSVNNSSKSKSSGNSNNSESVSLDVCELDLGDILISPGENSKNCSNHTENDSELIDDPGICNNVMDSDSSVSSGNEILSNDPDVVLLCVKHPTYEVITLEDEDDSEDIVEEVHECVQCGKSFRAKSLLNFHIRMHGNDSASSFQSFSIS